MVLCIVFGLLLVGWAVKTYRTAHPTTLQASRQTTKMHEANFEEGMEQILTKDPRYHRDAYLFVREALDHTQKTISKESAANCATSAVRNCWAASVIMRCRNMARWP